MMSFPDTSSMDWYLQAKEMLVEAGASPQAAVLGGATIAGFFAAACRCDTECRPRWIFVSLRHGEPLEADLPPNALPLFSAFSHIICGGVSVGV